MTGVTEALDLLDLAVARADGVADPAELRSAADVAQRVRLRRDLLSDSLIVALVGGTGSGKSSLLNAIAGEPVASVSAIRPHTDHPQAWTPERDDPTVGLLLDELGIDDRVPNDTLPGTTLVDLPDMDSVIEWHRRTVEDLLPRVDAVMWVFDPVKYSDPVLHEAFLRPLAAYRHQFVFVLNQIDIVADTELAPIRSHLLGILDHGGFPDAALFTTAAAPRQGEPQGIDELRSFLGSRLDVKRTALGKLVEDIRTAANTLADSAGVWDGSSVDFDARWAELRAVMTPEAAAGRFIATVAQEIGPATTDRLRGALAVADGSVTEDDLRDPLWDRARLGATLASLGVVCTELRQELARDRDEARLPAENQGPPRLDVIQG